MRDEEDVNAARDFAKNIKDAFASVDAPATKRDIAHLYAVITLAIDAISAARSDLSYDPRTEDGIRATTRYKAAMDAVLNGVRDGIADIVSEVDKHGK